PLLGNNRSRLIERCAQLVAEDKANEFLYLAASHPLLELATEQILDGARNRGVWGELPVYLFRGFVRHLISTAVDDSNGNYFPPRLPIDGDELPLKRSLISQVLLRLKAEGKLRAIASLANREGCINTITTLIGEIQRAGKTPSEFSEIVSSRAQDSSLDGIINHKIAESLSVSDPGQGRSRLLHPQIDFDQDVALVYSTYADLLEENKLTEDDADGLRAIQILRGDLAGHAHLPWLKDVRLLVLDGFFDFTPAQGEMLKLLIPQIPEVLVNLNKDNRNPEIFTPFNDTISQLSSIADFDIRYSPSSLITPGALLPLRERLFNPSLANQQLTDDLSEEVAVNGASEILYFDCTDRETEIRAIAKEIKRLVLIEDYKLSDIALVVRERASYAETITRVMREESLPCSLDRRITVAAIPAARAALKLLGILDELARDESRILKMPPLADQIKSGYFRLPQEDLDALAKDFEKKFADLLFEGEAVDADRLERRRRVFGIGRWDADTLENVIAYVGGELRLTDWVDRCRKLIEQLPGAEATKELLNIDSAEPVSDDDEAQMEDAETLQPEDKQVEKKRRPQRDVHPAVIAWAMLVVSRFAARIQAVSREAEPLELRAAIMKLLDQFQFSRQVRGPVRHTDDDDLPSAILDLHALEGLRRAFLTAIKSIQLTQPPSTENKSLVSLTSIIDEVRRCLNSQTVMLGSAERGGLRVLEATDVRGLRFRAVFVAGLVEGGFPLSASRDWIYPHEERERLKRYGLTLEDISPNSLLKEEHYFYQAACRATERLYLTRPLMLQGDTETVASYYIDELRRAIAPAKLVKRDVVRPDYDGMRLREASSAKEVAISLVRQEQHHLNNVAREGLRPHPQISRLLALARNDRLVSESALDRIAIERERSGDSFGPYDGQITDPDLLALIKKKFGPDFVHSASGLGTFGNCAYRFFAQRVLKLEPRGEAALDLQALDAGKLLHDILRRFFEHHRGERLDPVKRPELTKELLEIADEVFNLHEKVVPPLNKQVWKLDREIRKIILEQVLVYELELQEKTAAAGVTPSRFELAFGGMKSAARDPDSTEEPLQLARSTLVGEETIKISGQIDRVDIAQDKTLVAYDYKLSRGARKEDIYEGRNLQIPIYLEALEKLFFPGQKIAGGGYYTLRGGAERRNTGMYRKDFNDTYLALQAKNSIFSEYEWQQFRGEVTARIWDFLDRIHAGRFTVDPSEGAKTCKFCDYLAVCRYHKYRIDRKKPRKEEL
ncbi:MAG TPA: PD-(D/E)XK nuclease family protein, partial [Pyrinomonadaceae bacterium]